MPVVTTVKRERGRVVRSVVFTTAMILVESNKQQIEEVEPKVQAENSGTRATSSKSGFVRIAPPSLSRDRRIKMKKSINYQTTRVSQKIMSPSLSWPYLLQ